MKSPRRLSILFLALVLLFGAGLYIAFSVPPLDRPSYWIDAENMIAQVVSLPNRRPPQLILDLKSGVLKSEENRIPVYSEQEQLMSWRLYQVKSQQWELVVTRPDGGKLQKLFAFPVAPSVLDENTIIGCSDNEVYILNLRTNQLVTHPITSPSFLIKVLRTQTLRNPRCFLQVAESASAQVAGSKSVTVSLFSIDEDNSAKLTWNKPIHSQLAYQVIGDRVYMIGPNLVSVDCYDLDSGVLVQSTNFPSELLSQLNDPLTSSFSLADLPRPIIWINSDDTASYWSIPDFKQLQLPNNQSVLFRLGNHTEQIGFARYHGQKVGELGAFDLSTQQTIWSHFVDREIQVFDQSNSSNLLCYGTSRFGGADFTALDSSNGMVISQWAPFRWLSWCLPICIMGLVGCSLATVRYTSVCFPSNLKIHWIVLLLLSIVYLVPLITHLWYWKTFNRPIPVHHYIEGWFVGALVFCAAWIVWGSGRIVIRLIPPFLTIGVLVGLTRLMLADDRLLMEAVGSTLVAAAFSLPLFVGLRRIGIRLFEPADSVTATVTAKSTWTIPIRDLFLLSTGIAVLLAVSMPLVMSLTVPDGLPSGMKQMIISGIALYAGITLLILCDHFRFSWLTSAIIMGLAITISLAATYEFVTGQNLIYSQSSFEMALFRVAVTTKITFVCFFRLFQRTRV